MSENFNLEIVNPEESFLKKKVSEVVVPGIEGEMGILFNHIPIISFLKPGLLKVYSDEGEQNFYIEEGIIEFKENTLSILTNEIIDIKQKEKINIDEKVKKSQEELLKDNISDETRFILNQKIDTLKLISML